MNIIRYLHDASGGGILDRQQQVSKVYYTWPAQANVLCGQIAPSVPAPVAILLTPSEWRIDTDQAVARETLTAVVYYLLPQPQLDFDATSNEVLIDRCIAAAVELIGMLRADRRLAVLDAVMDATSLYDINDRNLTGVRLRVKIKDNAGYCIDTPPLCN